MTTGEGATPAAGRSDSGEQQPKQEPQQQPQQQPKGAADGDLGDAGKRALEAEREARKAAEAKAREVEAKLKEYDDAKLTESERLQNMASDAERGKLAAEQELTAERFSRRVERAAAKTGFLDPEVAVQLIDRAAVKTDDDGFPEDKSLDAALKALANAKPYLVGGSPNGSADSGARRSAPAGVNMNDLIREASGHQT